MSQSSVEVLIGRLATDEEFRARFAADRRSALEEFVATGHALTPAERSALEATDIRRCEQFADAIDPRLQKASLRTAAGLFRCPERRGR
jgi:hypothetical protein